MPVRIEPTHWTLPHEQQSHGCFETMRVYNGKIFRLEAHLDRLYASAKYLGTQAPAGREGLRRRLLAQLARSGMKEAVVRVALMPRAGQDAHPNVVVVEAIVPAAKYYRQGMRVAVVPTRSFAVDAVDPIAKYSARLGSKMAIIDAQLRNADEALFTDVEGYVTESTASNFGIIRQGVIVTPPCFQGLLGGITRDVLFELAHAMEHPIAEEPLTRHDVYNAQEAFLLSTLKEVMPVTEIDGRQIGNGKPGPLCKALRQAFRRLVRRESADPKPSRPSRRKK